MEYIITSCVSLEEYKHTPATPFKNDLSIPFSLPPLPHRLPAEIQMLAEIPVNETDAVPGPSWQHMRAGVTSRAAVAASELGLPEQKKNGNHTRNIKTRQQGHRLNYREVISDHWQTPAPCPSPPLSVLVGRPRPLFHPLLGLTRTFTQTLRHTFYFRSHPQARTLADQTGSRSHTLALIRTHIYTQLAHANTESLSNTHECSDSKTHTHTSPQSQVASLATGCFLSTNLKRSRTG